jgi:hypothetical protein
VGAAVQVSGPMFCIHSHMLYCARCLLPHTSGFIVFNGGLNCSGLANCDAWLWGFEVVIGDGW